MVKRLSRSGRSGPIMSRSSLLRPRSDSSHHQSASCSNLEQLEGRRYSVTYFKHKVVDSDSVNRCGDHNVNVVNVERNATKTQLQLYNVLKSFSLYQRAIGYTSNSGLRFTLSVPFLFGSDLVVVHSGRRCFANLGHFDGGTMSTISARSFYVHFDTLNSLESLKWTLCFPHSLSHSVTLCVSPTVDVIECGLRCTA